MFWRQKKKARDPKKHMEQALEAVSHQWSQFEAQSVRMGAELEAGGSGQPLLQA